MMQTENEFDSYLQKYFSPLPFASCMKIVAHEILRDICKDEAEQIPRGQKWSLHNFLQKTMNSKFTKNRRSHLVRPVVSTSALAVPMISSENFSVEYSGFVFIEEALYRHSETTVEPFLDEAGSSDPYQPTGEDDYEAEKDSES
jgi:hypothetical protein